MKKIIMALLLVLLVGCGRSNEAEKKPETPIEETPQETAEDEQQREPIDPEIEATVRSIFAQNAPDYVLSDSDEWLVELSDPLVSITIDPDTETITLLRYYPNEDNRILVLRVSGELLIP